MSSSADPVPASGKKLPWGKLVVVGLLLVAVVGLALRGVGWAQLKEWWTRALTLLQEAGPLAFFTAMTVLPMFGFPLSAFTLTAGQAFGGQLTLVGVLAACAVSVAINLSISYWLARRWLRPLVEKLITRAGYKVPVVPQADQFELTLLLRITPGPPFFFQNYLLGLAGIPFRLYFLVSWTFVMIQGGGVVIFGKYLKEGKGGGIMIGASVIVAVVLIVHIVRRHYAKRGKK